MNKKQIISLGTCMCLFLNTSVFAKGIQKTEYRNTGNLYTNERKSVMDNTGNSVSVEEIILTENYSKVKITNLITNEVEWLEQFLEKDSNGDISRKMIAINEDGEKTLIETKDDVIVVSKNNVILDEIPIVKAPLVKAPLVKAPVYNSYLRSYGDWQGPLVTYTDRAFLAGWSVSVVTGILASMIFPGLGTVASSLLSSTAGAIVGLGIKNVWIKLVDYTRVDQQNSKYETKRTAYFYKVSNYTDLIGNPVGPYTWEYDYSGL